MDKQKMYRWKRNIKHTKTNTIGKYKTKKNDSWFSNLYKKKTYWKYNIWKKFWMNVKSFLKNAVDFFTDVI